MGGEYLRDGGHLMPRGVINREDDRLAQGGRISTCEVGQMSRKGVLEPDGFRQSALAFSLGRTLHQASRQLPGHHIERRKTIDLVLVIPCADGGAIALHAQRGP